MNSDLCVAIPCLLFLPSGSRCCGGSEHPDSDFVAVRRHLAAGRWEEAANITLDHAPADAHDEIRLFFDATSQRLASEGHAEASLAEDASPS
jgi:hypothetical protein